MSMSEQLAHIKATMEKADEPLSDAQYSFLCGYLLTTESHVRHALRTACHLLASEETTETEIKIFIDNVSVLLSDVSTRVN